MKASIIGGGIGGLAAAIALKQKGLEVKVFERASKLGEVGAGISLWANATHALEKLGLALSQMAAPEQSGAIRDWQGRVLVRPNNTVKESLSMVFHRAELHQALLEQLGIQRVQLGKELVSLTQDDRGVSAQFADGSSEYSDFLVGADGLRSRVRAILHGDTPPVYSGYTAWRGLIPFDTSKLKVGESWGLGARFGQVEVLGGRIYWFATQNIPAGHKASSEKAELLKIFADWHDPIPQLIQATPEAAILRNDIFDRPPLEVWGKGRVTLLGDAAHPMTPNLGQGACQALEDAVVLAQILDNIPASLRQYEALRAPRTANIVKLSRQIGQLGQLQNPLMVWLRNTAIANLPPSIQQRQIEQIVSFRV